MASAPREQLGSAAAWGPHPDSDLLSEAQSAIDWWTREQPARPTSSLVGGGAFEAAEQYMSELVLGRPVLALPSATFATLVALQAAGVGTGSEVLVSGIDWPAARAAARVLGASVVPVPVSTDDLTMDARAVAACVSPNTRALVVTHLHGLMADVKAIQAALPDGVLVIEDCAQAFHAHRGVRPAGAFGDYAVFSLGARKAVSAGEMGLLVSASRSRRLAAVAVSQHPIRQLLAGITEPRADVLMGRPAPLMAVLAAYKLSRWEDVERQLQQLDITVRSVVENTGATVLGSGLQLHQPGCVPIAVGSDEIERALRDALKASFEYAAEIAVSASGALVDPDLEARDREQLTDVLGRVRLVGVRLPPTPYRR